MVNSVFFFLLLSIACVLVEAFFSSFEMAALSFNKMRLEYLSQKKKKKAQYLLFLLKKPSRLFGTTLIMVTVVLQLGSEAARRFYETLGFDPDLAPITQVVMAVVFGELVPLFAARRHSEQVALFSVNVVYRITKFLAPVIFLIDKISYYLNKAFKKSSSDLFFTKEELQKAFEERENLFSSRRLSHRVSTIFNFKNIKAKQIVLPLEVAKMADSRMNLFEFKKQFFKKDDHFLIYHDKKQNIVGHVTLADLLDLQLSDRIISASRSVWFVTENTSLLSLIKEFRFNHQKIAIVLDESGQAIGFLSLEIIINLIFESRYSKSKIKKQIDMTLSGKMAVYEFNLRFKANLPFEYKTDTLSDLINKTLSHHPVKGETVLISGYELTVQTPSFLGSRKIKIKSTS